MENRNFSQIFSSKSGKVVWAALEEDIGQGDVTSNLLIKGQAKAAAEIRAKEAGIFCGGLLVREVFRRVDPSLKVRLHVREGNRFRKGRRVISLSGRVKSILAGERTALNFLGLLSGIATVTDLFVRKARKGKVLVYDTRKTIPLLREFQKYAVRTGGGRNHRMGLDDAVLVKENHRRFGNLGKLKRRRKRFEIEVRNLKELRDALSLSPRIILLDNFKPDSLRRAVKMVRQRKAKVILEASGGITLRNIARYAATGIDRVSVGSLTHSVRSLDFSLLVD